MSVYMKNLRPEYKESSKVKFRLCGRGKYPTKSYSNTSSEYLTLSIYQVVVIEKYWW